MAKISWRFLGAYVSLVLILSSILAWGLIRQNPIATIITVIFDAITLILTLLQVFHPHKPSSNELRVFCGIVAVSLIIGGYVVYNAFSATPVLHVTSLSVQSASSLTSTPVMQNTPPTIVQLTPTPTSTSVAYSTPSPTQPTPSPTTVQPFSIKAPGCYGDDSLENAQSLVFLCPQQDASTVNPYNDFQAKNENLAQADTAESPLMLRGTVEIKSQNIPCINGCKISANVLFHNETTDFRVSTKIGLLSADYGVLVDRSGKVYQVSKNQGDYTVTNINQLPNFPTGDALVKNDNPINLQISYTPGKNIFFNIAFKDNGQNQHTIPINLDISSSEINLGGTTNNLLKIFVENDVDPKAYSGEFQHNPVDFGDSSIIGIGEINVIANS